MLPKDLTSIQTNLSPMDFYTLMGRFEADPSEFHQNHEMVLEGSVIRKYFHDGMYYQFIIEYGLLVSVMSI